MLWILSFEGDKMKILLFLLIAISFLKAEIVVVTNKNSQIEPLAKEMVQYLYLSKTDKIKETKVEALLCEDEELHNNFCQNILGKSESQYNGYRARLLFSGKKSITKKLEFEDVVKKLQEPNTIAYIRREDLREEWKIIYVQN